MDTHFDLLKIIFNCVIKLLVFLTKLKKVLDVAANVNLNAKIQFV